MFETVLRWLCLKCNIITIIDPNDLEVKGSWPNWICLDDEVDKP